MSGTSLDGLDIAYCTFHQTAAQGWTFEIIQAETLPYSPAWVARLEVLPNSTARHITKLNYDYGRMMGQKVRAFLKSHQLEADLVASHGHTVFHDPPNHITVQLGDASALAATCGLPVVADFRAMDVSLGGEGAPLVPVGDAMLFGDYALCLNLGGIANVSFTDAQGQRIAGDVVACNQVLNYLAQLLGERFDNEGEIARGATPDPELVRKLNTLPFFTRDFPRSLGREWVEEEVLPLLVSSSSSVPVQMASFVRHIVDQISGMLDRVGTEQDKMLITGGGAYNTFLIEELQRRTRIELEIPNRQLVDFKEALIFAFLGVLRWRHEVNVWASVTGAASDHSGGVIALPPQAILTEN